MNYYELTETIKEMQASGESPETQCSFANVLKKIIKNDEWVFVPLRTYNENRSFCIVEMHNAAWAVMFSDETMIKNGKEIDIASTGISKLVKFVLLSDEIVGIAINPFSQEHAYITKDILVDILMG